MIEELNITDNATQLAAKVNSNFGNEVVSIDDSATKLSQSMNTAFGHQSNQLSPSMNAVQFVSIANDNFASMQVGDGSRIYMAMQGGGIENGLTKGSISSSSQFMTYCHTKLLLDISQGTITEVSVDDGETLKIACFGTNRNWLSDVSSVESIPQQARYVRFQVNKSSSYTAIRSNLSVSYTGIVSTSKNDIPTKVTSRFFSFDSSLPNHSGRVWDNGWIKLPPNYTADGDPVPVVVFCHGTNGYSRFGGTSPSQFGTYGGRYDELLSFVANNGYAVCDCHGGTSANSSLGNSAGLPSMTTSVVAMLDHISENYNIDRTKVFVAGKSAGGYHACLTTFLDAVGAVAAGVLAPAIINTWAMQNNYHTEGLNNALAEQVGIDYTFAGELTGGGTSECCGYTITGDKAKVIEEFDKLREWDAFFADTDITDEDAMSALATMFGTNSPSYCDSGFSGNQLTLPCPMKIWCSRDDGNVRYNTTAAYCAMADNAGSDITLRTMANGHGGHHCVDTADNAERTDYETKYGGDPVDIATGLQVALAYAELVQWFDTFLTQTQS